MYITCCMGLEPFRTEISKYVHCQIFENEVYVSFVINIPNPKIYTCIKL